MVRPRTEIPSDAEQIRTTLIKELGGSPTSADDTLTMQPGYEYHPDCPYANKMTGMVIKARYIWWMNYPDDRLTKYDTIKHKNGDRRDCRIDNLIKVNKRQRFVISKACPYADSETGRVLEEHYVWWKNHPDDAIKCGERIIHINGNNSDNRIENLIKKPRGNRKSNSVDIVQD